MNFVPLSAGGTGATTAGAALTALGGASLASASSQSFAGPLNAPSVNANVNKQINVMAPPYNAKCNGVTDDQASIQAAFNDALSNGQPVFFPAGTCVTSTIVWRGQSFFGAGMGLTIIRGRPGQDVFQGPDTAVNYPYAVEIHDLQIQVDASVNAASTAVGGNGSFPYRISGMAGGTGTLTNPPTVNALPTPPAPGPMVFGPSIPFSCSGSITSGSTTFTLPCGLFENIPPIYGAGQQITINGAGSGGTPLVTTISSVISNTQVAIGAAASTTTMTASGSWGGSMTAPWYFGNCGIAVPMSDGANNATINGSNFKNVWFTSVNRPTSPGVHNNYTCGIFIQAAPNDLHFQRVDFQALWGGYIEALPVAHLNSLFAWTPDTSSYKDMNFKFDNIPMVMYNGTHRVLDGMNFYSGAGNNYLLGPFQFDATVNGFSGFPSASITRFYHECSVQNSGESTRFSGRQDNVLSGELNECPQAYVNWMASGSIVNAEFANLHIGGNDNRFTQTNLTSAALVTDNGNDNIVESNYSSYASQKRAYLNRPREPLNKLDAGFLLSGNSATPYTSSSDLLITCPEFNWAFQNPSHPPAGCTPDSTGTEISQSYFHGTATNYPSGWPMEGSGFGSGPYGKYLIVGDRVPKTNINVVLQARCDSACTQAVTIYDLTTGNTTLANATLSFGTGWTLQTIPVDLTAINSGDRIWFNFGAISSGATYEDLALIGLQPVNTDATVAIYSKSGPPIGAQSYGGTLNFSAKVLELSNAYGIADATSPTGYSLTTSNPLNIGNWPVGGSTVPLQQGAINFTAKAPAIYASTLNGAITNSATSITLNLATTSAFPNNGYLLIDNEIVKYTGTPSVGTTTLTVTRAQGGTAALAHSNGAPVSNVAFGTMYVSCNSVNASVFNMYVTQNWQNFPGFFDGTICGGYNIQWGLSFTTAFTGQTYSLSNVAFTPYAELPHATGANLVPVSNGSSPYPYGSTKALAGAGAAIATGPSSGTTANDLVCYSGTNGQQQDCGKALPLVGTTGSIGGSSLAAGACASGTVNITGATTGMAAVASPVTYPGDGMIWKPYVSAAGVVTVKVCAVTAGTPTT